MCNSHLHLYVWVLHSSQCTVEKQAQFASCAQTLSDGTPPIIGRDQCFGGQSLTVKAAELDGCSDCIQSLIRERNSEIYDGKKFKRFIENLKNVF